MTLSLVAARLSALQLAACNERLCRNVLSLKEKVEVTGTATKGLGADQGFRRMAELASGGGQHRDHVRQGQHEEPCAC